VTKAEADLAELISAHRFGPPIS